VKSFTIPNLLSLTFFVTALLATEGCLSRAGPPDLRMNRATLFAVLQTNGVLAKDRQLVHLSYVGSLELEGQSFPVIDIMELVPGASTPRGINGIVILDPFLAPVKEIEYTTERPLFCRGNQLFVWGDLSIAGILPEGNVLTFTEHGRKIEIGQIDFNKLPTESVRDAEKIK
jgi:hypothetical protein